MKVTKQMRMKAVEECLSGKYKGLIAGLPDFLVEEYRFKKYSIATINRDIREIKEQNEASDYEADIPAVSLSKLIKKDIEALFIYDSPKINSLISTGVKITNTKKEKPNNVSQKIVHSIYFSTRKNTAPILAKLLDKLYGTKILGTTHGDNLVILYTTSADNAEKYYTQLKKLRPKSSTTDSKVVDNDNVD